jgi:hypothetical protein
LFADQLREREAVAAAQRDTSRTLPPALLPVALSVFGALEQLQGARVYVLPAFPLCMFCNNLSGTCARATLRSLLPPAAFNSHQRHSACAFAPCFPSTQPPPIPLPARPSKRRRRVWAHSEARALTLRPWWLQGTGSGLRRWAARATAGLRCSCHRRQLCQVCHVCQVYIQSVMSTS